MAPFIGVSVAGIHLRCLQSVLLFCGWIFFVVNPKRTGAFLAGKLNVSRKEWGPQGEKDSMLTPPTGPPKELGLGEAREPLLSGNLRGDITAEDVLNWAQHPTQKGMQPGYPVRAVQCGINLEAKLSVPRYIRDYEDARKLYKRNVLNYTVKRRASLDQLKSSAYVDAGRILFVQWNAEQFVPTAWELLQAVIPANGPKADVNLLDAFIISLQEINKLKSRDYLSYIESMVPALNSLSRRKSWSANSSAYTQLNNIIGTKLFKIGTLANTQAIIFLGRNHIAADSIAHCRWAWHFREKGFVGISAIIGRDSTRILVLGAHLLTPKANQARFLDLMLHKARRLCVPSRQRFLGFDYFAGGVYLIGDMNARLSTQTAKVLIGSLATNPLFDELNKVVADAGQSFEQARLLYMLGASPAAKEVKYAPILYALDNLGGSPGRYSHKNLSAVLLRFGFQTISVCYAGLITYKWEKKCSPQRQNTFRQCLSIPSRRDTNLIGYLDRLLIRRPGGSSTGEKSTYSLPQSNAFIIAAGQLLDFRGDHLPQMYVVEIWATGQKITRWKSAPYVLQQDVGFT